MASTSICANLMRSASATAVVAGFGLLVVASQAQAVVVHSGVVNLNVPSTTAGIYLNVVSGVSGTTTAAVPGWDLNPWSSSGFSIWANNAAELANGVIIGNGTATQVDNLPLGYVVDATGVFGRTAAVETAGAFSFIANSNGNYIGFRFNDGANTLFGWARFELSSSISSQPRTLVEYAYETSGAGIAVGAVPEPGTYAMMGLGVASLLLATRRRQRV
jgi:hypothetical protein